MSLQDKKNSNENTIALVNKFVESNQRKRKNLIQEIESSVDDIYALGEDLFSGLDRKSDDWAFGWILQVLKKYKKDFFNNKIYNNWFISDSRCEINYELLQLNLLAIYTLFATDPPQDSL